MSDREQVTKKAPEGTSTRFVIVSVSLNSAQLFMVFTPGTRIVSGVCGERVTRTCSPRVVARVPSLA
jgi:hypothetical protein